MGNLPIERLAGEVTRNSPEQVEPPRSKSALNLNLGRQTAQSRQGYKKATQRPVWGRSLELRGLETGILATRIPETLHSNWNDSGTSAASIHKLTFQVRVQPINLDQVGDTEIPYSLDYGGYHDRPVTADAAEVGFIGNPRITSLVSNVTEDTDPLLYKPAAANRYDATAGKKYPWLPGVSAITVNESLSIKPRMLCVWGTGPLREFPRWQYDCAQRNWITAFHNPSPPATWLTANYFTRPSPVASSNNVNAGDCDAGDLYLFWVYSPITAAWYLMALWEYSDPGFTGTHAQGMNRLYTFVGWGDAADNRAAVAVDPTVAHTVTVHWKRDFTAAAPGELSIWVDDPFDGALVQPKDGYGVNTDVPAPGGGPNPGNAASAPVFDLQALSGIGGIAKYGKAGRSIYLGGLPKATNARSVWGYGCGRSTNPGGLTGVTCPFPGRITEFRLYCGDFVTTGGSRDYAATALLAPHNSRTIKRLQGGLIWDHITSPAVTKYTGCINIWRLDDEAGDIFVPLYTFGGVAGKTFFNGGFPAGATQDFHPFEPISNGALIAPGTLQASSGSMRFNGGSPAFTLRAATYRKGSGTVIQDQEGRSQSVTEALEKFNIPLPPSQFSWGCIYRVTTAPVIEPPGATGSGGAVPYPATNKPHQGEVHTLMQLASPNRSGKDEDTVITDTNIRDLQLGQNQGIAAGYDHPDTFWEGATDAGVSNKSFLPSGHKDLELARVDLVAHVVDTTGGGVLARRYAIRADFGYGAEYDDYFDFSVNQKAKQQRGNEAFFRSNFDLAVPAVNKPFDVDDDYQAKTLGQQGDDRYTYVFLCDSAGVVFGNPKDIEGRTYAIFSSYALNPKDDAGSTTELGRQVLTVWDVTNPNAIFELAPAGTNTSRLSAECGLSHPVTELHGTNKMYLCLGGKIPPQFSDWWVSNDFDDYHAPGQSEHLYPYGCWAISNTGDQREDPFSVGCSAQAVTNGAKGSMDVAVVFRQSASKSTVLAFFKALAVATEPWHGSLPPAAKNAIEGNAQAVWLVDADSGPLAVDVVGGQHLGLDEAIASIPTHGGPQFPVSPNGAHNIQSRNHPYSYNNGVFASMFPDLFLPARNVNTGRAASLYGDISFSDEVVAAGITQGEAPNIQPTPEKLIAVFSHVRQVTTDIMCLSKTSVFRYSPLGNGELARIASLPKHFTDTSVVSRDAIAERTLLTNPAASPVLIDSDGRPTRTEFIAAPRYGVPVVWARTWKAFATQFGTQIETLPPQNEWPFVFQIADETTLPRSDTVLGIERVDADQGLIWTGEMPRLISGVTAAPWGTALEALVTTPPTDILTWRFFFTYYSKKLGAESRPGRVFAFSNVLPLRAPKSGDLGTALTAPFVNTVPNDKYTGMPNTKGVVLVMEGQVPTNVEDVLGDGQGQAQQARYYNLKIRNVPVSPNPDVTHLRVYRTIANGSEFFLEAELAIAAGEAAKDSRITVPVGVKNDFDLSEIFLAGLGGTVPAGARFTAAYQGRAFYAGFNYALARIAFSYAGRPGSVPFFYYIDLVGGDSAPITALYVDKDRLWCHKEDSVFVGTVREFDIYTLDQASVGLPVKFELTSARAGAVGDRALASVPEKGIIFAGDTSVWAHQGIQQTRVSAAIDGESPSDVRLPGVAAARIAEHRVLYPYVLNNSVRDRWRVVYYPQRRQVLIFGILGDPTLVLHTDLMEWTHYTNYNFDDTMVTSLINSETSEMWGIRDSRLFKLDDGESDCLDYSADALATTFLTAAGGGPLGAGALTVVSATNDITTDLAVASLGATYQGLLAPNSTERVAKDLFRGTRIRVTVAATGAARGEAIIRHAYASGGNVRFVLATGISGMIPGDIFSVASIPSHWVSSMLQPTNGRQMIEALAAVLRRTDRKLAASLMGTSQDLRAVVDVYFAYDKEVFDIGDLAMRFSSGGFPLVPAAALRKLEVRSMRGRGDSMLLGWYKDGIYAPVEMIDASVDFATMLDTGRLEG